VSRPFITPSPKGARTAGGWWVDPKAPLCVESPSGNVCLTNLARNNLADAAFIAKADRHFDAMQLLLIRAESLLVEATRHVPKRQPGERASAPDKFRRLIDEINARLIDVEKSN